MKVLFVGESWSGSGARSLREALARSKDVQLDELAEDAFFPRANFRILRAVNRVLRPFQRRELTRELLGKISSEKPDVMLVYKGAALDSDVVRAVKRLDVKTVNVYPDYSPHAYGAVHRQAVGEYDLVISTKPYHPEIWATVYGYGNRCVFVPQGYDPALHLVEAPPRDFTYDVAMVATYRPEYGRLMVEFARTEGAGKLKLVIGGNGWEKLRAQLPENWVLAGAARGRGYVSLLRSAKICIAPVNREVLIDGRSQPGDVDTTRTYELAAAHCFFIHRRTDFVEQLYGKQGVPMFDDAQDLAAQIGHFLERPDERVRIAAAAHMRAVPEFSTDSRAADIVAVLKQEYEKR